MTDTLDLDAKALALFEQALDLPSGQRHQWLVTQAAQNRLLRQKLLALLRADVEEGLAIGTGAAITDHLAKGPPPPSHIGAYRITERIGQGGMGAVYKGVRDAGDFDHTVAVKFIKPGLLADRLKSRFQNEQNILAQFTHPNIARLYDGGETDDGSPFIIMEYIEGASLTDWANQHKLDLNQRLALFQTTCRAVAYAHQNLIVHQDLTPSNVLVTENGEVKLIDFGIAKPQVEGADRNAPSGSLASLSFTPGFAAPERFEGAGANTLSDVYSLGRLLEALIGAKPQIAEIRAIVTRATQADPDQRYPSVTALHDDVDNYLGGHPVNAMAGGSFYRFSKFVRRNRAAVTSITVAFFALLGGLLLTTNLYRSAETARASADQRFNDVRTLAKTMMFDIYDEIDAVPGALKARQALATAAQTYLNDLSLDDASTNELKVEAAKGFIRLSDIQGSPRMSHTGNYEEALENLGRAEKILSALPSQNNIAVLSALRDMAFIKATRKFYIEGQTTTAADYLQQSIEFGERALALAPNDLQLVTDVLQSRMEQAINLRWDNRVDEALDAIRKVVTEYELLLAKHPGEDVVLEEYAKALRTNAEFLSLSDAAIDAIPLAEKAIALEIRRGSNDPGGDLSQLRAMAYSHWRLATPHWTLKNFSEAVRNYEQAIDYTKAIVRRDPGNEDAARSLASYQGEAAISLVELGRYEEAETYMQSAKAHFSDRFSKNPDLGSAQRSLMVMHAQMTAFYQGWGKHEERCVSLDALQSIAKLMDSSGNLIENDRAGLQSFVESQPPCPQLEPKK